MTTVLDDLEKFRTAVGQAQMTGHDYLEVSERLFKYLVKDANSKFLTYGQPGIKVYKAGTREQLERDQHMSSDDYYKRLVEERKKVV